MKDELTRKLVEEGVLDIGQTSQEPFVFAWVSIRVWQVSANESAARIVEAQGFRIGQIARMITWADNVARISLETAPGIQSMLKDHPANWFATIQVIGARDPNSSSYTTMIAQSLDGSSVEIGFARGGLWRDNLLRDSEVVEIKIMGMKAS